MLVTMLSMQSSLSVYFKIEKSSKIVGEYFARETGKPESNQVYVYDPELSIFHASALLTIHLRDKAINSRLSIAEANKQVV